MKTRANALMILAMLTGLAACGPDGGDAPGVGEKVAPDGGRPMAVNVAPTPMEADGFLGRWTYLTGDYTISCPGQPVRSKPATTPVTFIAGTTPDEIIATDGSGCDIPCTVSCNVATAAPGFVCPGDLAVESLVYT